MSELGMTFGALTLGLAAKMYYDGKYAGVEYVKSKVDNREKELIKLNSTDHHISLGELSLFSIDKKRIATVKSITSCEIGRLNFSDLFEICEKNHHLSVYYLILEI